MLRKKMQDCQHRQRVNQRPISCPESGMPRRLSTEIDTSQSLQGEGPRNTSQGTESTSLFDPPGPPETEKQLPPTPQICPRGSRRAQLRTLLCPAFPAQTPTQAGQRWTFTTNPAVVLTWHRCPQCNKHHRSDRVLQADGAAKVGCQVADESCQEADHEDGDDEASPAVPVVCWGHEGKKDLPEDGQKVHHVVKAGGQLLLPTFIVIIVFPWRKPTVPD